MEKFVHQLASETSRFGSLPACGYISSPTAKHSHDLQHKWSICGCAVADVDLQRVTMPVLNVYATEDHLVPPASSQALEHYVGSNDFTTISFAGGHIGIYVSGRAQKELAPALANWVRERCD